MANKSRIDTHIYNAIKYQMDYTLHTKYIMIMYIMWDNK